MKYRSISDLADTIRGNLYKIPNDVDLIVGIPRSGMLAASIIALNLNKQLCDLNAFINDAELENGQTRDINKWKIFRPSEAKHTLVVDDSIQSGKSLSIARQRLSQCGRDGKVSFCGVYVAPQSIDHADIALEILESDRSFEWNTMHHPHRLPQCCVDIDGILCVDPRVDQNDDGEKYIDFIINATPLVKPSYEIAHLVTARLEKYRAHTEAWLSKHNIKYKNLHMLDLPDAETRRRLNCHSLFKANTYKNLDSATLFIESERNQAIDIANRSGKEVLCFETQELFQPCFSMLTTKTTVNKQLRKQLARIARRINKYFRYI